MEEYIYIGEHYDVLNRGIIINDKKIGLSDTPPRREKELTRTKSPVKYRIIEVYKVDDMKRVENLLHAILDSRRVDGEWFRDDDDTLVGDFIGFMDKYGAEKCSMEELKSINETPKTEDKRLITVFDKFVNTDPVVKEEGMVRLIRRYKGVDYDVILNCAGILCFKGGEYDTPNKLYNNGIVKYVTGKKGGSGTNQMTQFTLKTTGERLSEPVVD
jgi:hypothetical protein|tara:strand:- start:2610 stop:3254 length:645 start_codon:yes stop_codon:yes gene_type:complete